MLMHFSLPAGGLCVCVCVCVCVCACMSICRKEDGMFMKSLHTYLHHQSLLFLPVETFAAGCYVCNSVAVCKEQSSD